MEKCNKEMWALGAWFYCTLPKSHDGSCQGEMPDMSFEDFQRTNGRLTSPKDIQ